jgi:putative transposase
MYAAMYLEMINLKYYSIHEFSKLIGRTPQTLRNWDKSGKLKPNHTGSGGYRYYSHQQLKEVLQIKGNSKDKIIIGYCRVSSNKQKDDLQRQIENMKLYLETLNKPYEIISDIGSGINYSKKGLRDLIKRITAGQAIKDACDAYYRFFKGLSGFPKFKSKRKSRTSFYNDNEKLKVKENEVLLEKIGWVKIKETIPLNCKYTRPTVSHDGKYWYLSVGVEQQNNKIELTDETVGIDVGVKDLAICSNGMKFNNINKTKTVKKTEKKLRRLQRKVSNKYEKNKKGESYQKTSNIKKLEKQIKLVHRRLNGIRKNHLHQATNKIVKTKPSKVVMETLNIQGMMKNKHLSKAIQQQGLYEFKRQMQYKCEFNGIEFIECDKWYPSSKTCSECGHIKKNLSLSERTYICEECGCIIDRDLNAAINLSRYSA